MSHPWKVGRLRELFARRRSGERTATLAAEEGVSPEALRQAWRYLGWSCRPVYDAERGRSSRDYKVWDLRRAGATYREVAARLGLDWSRKTFNALRMGEARYAKRIGLTRSSGRADRRAG